MELSTPALVVAAWYRLVGSESADDALVAHGESADDVAYQALTRGCRNAQRTMLGFGYGGWRVRSAALSFSGTDATTGGRYASLPSDFLRAAGSRRQSALEEANGDPWGQEVDDSKVKGNGYYLQGDELWLTRNASPPSTLYLAYHYTHPVWSASVTIDFPVDARYLIVAEAANVAKEESWEVVGPEGAGKIERALMRAKEEARGVARLTKSPRQFKRPYRGASHW